MLESLLRHIQRASLTGNEMDASGKVVNIRLLPAKVEDTDLGATMKSVSLSELFKSSSLTQVHRG